LFGGAPVFDAPRKKFRPSILVSTPSSVIGRLVWGATIAHRDAPPEAARKIS
jgi:hypothetical protein